MNHGKLASWIVLAGLVVIFLLELLVIARPPITSTRKGPFGWRK